VRVLSSFVLAAQSAVTSIIGDLSLGKGIGHALPAPTVREETIGSALQSAQKVSPITALAYRRNSPHILLAYVRRRSCIVAS
jgi:hypothetical protein